MKIDVEVSVGPIPAAGIISSPSASRTRTTSRSKLPDARPSSAMRSVRRAGSISPPLFTVSARFRMLATRLRSRSAKASWRTVSWLVAMRSAWPARALLVRREAMMAVTMLETTRVTTSTPTTL